jgi:predicted enzyme related to lactoylglutathione lyase
MVEQFDPQRKQPETLRLRAVIPVLTVNDLPTSLAWYRDVMGFIVTEERIEDGRLQAATLRAGIIDILLAQDDFARGRDRPKGEGFRIYCLTRQNVDQLAADIQARGGKLAQKPADQPGGRRDLAVVDPDGFKISIAHMEEP